MPTPSPPADRALPTLVVELPEPVDQPVVVTGPVQADRVVVTQTFVEDAGFSVARAPDFLLKVPRDHDNVRWIVAGHRGTLRVMRAQDYLNTGAVGHIGEQALKAGDWVVWVTGPADKGPTWTAIVTLKPVTGDPVTQFGAPAADASIEDHALNIYLPFFDSSTFYGLTVNTTGASMAHQLFTTMPREMFVFPMFDIDAGAYKIHKGEPLLLAVTPSFTTSATEAMTADGLLVRVKSKELTTAPAAIAVNQTPIKLTFKHAKDLSSRWQDEELVGLLTPDEAAAYKAKKAAASKCYEQAWKKLDPSGNSGGYVVVSHHGGSVNEENLADRHERSAVATCKLVAFEAARDKLEATVLARFEKARRGWHDELAARMAQLFPST